MATREDVESYILRLGVEHEEIDADMWLLQPPGGLSVVVQLSAPVVVLRLKVVELPRDGNERRLLALYRRLLEWNAGDLVHGSYGIAGDDVILSDALQLETLDFDELRSSYESLLLAAASHLPGLAEFDLVVHEG